MKNNNTLKSNKHTASKENISDIFCEYSHDYVTLSANVAEARNYLNFACIAWNLSLYPEHEMREKMEMVVNEYARLNPSTISSKKLKHDIEKLIEKKIKNHPNIKRLITKISIEEKGKNYLIFTESTEFQLARNI